MATSRTNRRGDRPQSVQKPRKAPVSKQPSVEDPNRTHLLSPAEIGDPGHLPEHSSPSRPANPQDGHEGQIGHTEVTECPNCHRQVALKVKDGKLLCPKCPLREDATGLRLTVAWKDT